MVSQNTSRGHDDGKREEDLKLLTSSQTTPSTTFYFLVLKCTLLLGSGSRKVIIAQLEPLLLTLLSLFSEVFKFKYQ